MCEVLNMTRQNYYKYRNTKDRDYYDYLEIKSVFEEGRELYGARKINHNLGTGNNNLNISEDIVSKWIKNII